MHNPHSMYLLGKSIQADRLKEAEQQRLVNLARSQKAEKAGSDRSSGQRLWLSLAARTGIVIALAVVLNIAG